MTALPTIEQAYRSILNVNNVLHSAKASGVCLHCGSYALHDWGWVTGVVVVRGGNAIQRAFNQPRYVFAACSACSEETIFVDGRVVFPVSVHAPPPVADLPPEIASEFEEARQIVAASPRGAAALLRLAIQKLCPILGATKPDINAAIGELVAIGKISPAIQQALDSVRVIGNEAVHPGTIDLNDDPATAASLFGLVNFIVEKAITEPKEIAAIYRDLPPNKLAGLAKRDAPKS